MDDKWAGVAWDDLLAKVRTAEKKADATWWADAGAASRSLTYRPSGYHNPFLSTNGPTAPAVGRGLDGTSGDRVRLLEWAQRQLARFTYKPGWKFRVDIRGYGGEVAVLATMTVEDTYNPGRTVEIGGWSRPMYFPGMSPRNGARSDEDWFAYYLASHIQALELHEAREWLKRDGAVFDDPHKDDPR